MAYSSSDSFSHKIWKGSLLTLIVVVGLLSIVGTGGGGGNGDEHGTLRFSSATYSATEGTDPTVTITVTRTGGDDGAVSVDYATADGSASQPGDYTTTTDTLNWADGDAVAKTFTVAITDDSTSESAENFTVALSNVVTAALGTPNTATVTITDDDNPGTLQLSSATYSVTEGVPNVTITVTRSGGSAGAASVDYATADDTAEAGTDYTAISATTLNWVDGNADDKIFTVTILDDSDLELTQAFDVVLSNATGATLGATTSASVSIIDNDSITITGNVYAPAGALAFKQPGLLERMFAGLFGNSVNAAVSDHVTPVAGVDVSVYEITEAGVVLMPPISTSTTDGFGAYTLLAPLSGVDSRYIVRAEGSMGEKLDARIVATTVDVDPATDATSRMVVTVGTNLINISTQEIIEMYEDIAEFITDIGTTGLDATGMSDGLYNKAAARVGQLNVLRSKDSAGVICGNVQSSGSSPLEDVLIIVRDYNDWTTRARTYTDASGDYCANVPIQGDTNPDGGTFSGEYIIGAINRTTDSSASEWLGASGTSYTQHDAMKISVTLVSSVVNNVDFALEPGVRINGTVKPTGLMTGVEGAQVAVRDFATNRRLASARVAADGSYSVSVISGSYRIFARNRTRAPYASEAYDGSGGTNIRNLAMPVAGVAGTPVNLDFELAAGSELSGTVNDGSAVIDTSVKIDIEGGATSENVGTDRTGHYNIWLSPDDYDVYAHGQQSLALNLASSATADFSSTVSSISGQLEDSPTNPVARATVRLYRLDDPTTTTMRDLESSDSNGNFTVYTDQTGDYIIEARITYESTVGSIIYDGVTRQLSGDLTNIAALGSSVSLPSVVTMPDGGMLRGHVYNEASGSMTLTGYGNFRVQVRDDDNLATSGTGTNLVDRFLQVRTLGDGSYAVALPAGIYDRVQLRDATGGGTGCGSVTITAGATTVLNFYDDGGTCEKP